MHLAIRFRSFIVTFSSTHFLRGTLTAVVKEIPIIILTLFIANAHAITWLKQNQKESQTECV